MDFCIGSLIFTFSATSFALFLRSQVQGKMTTVSAVVEGHLEAVDQVIASEFMTLTDEVREALVKRGSSDVDTICRLVDDLSKANSALRNVENLARRIPATNGFHPFEGAITHLKKELGIK